MSEQDWLDVLQGGLREMRPAWSLWWDDREFDGMGVRRCLVVGPLDAKVVVVEDAVLVFFGCHRFQHRLYIGDPRLIDKIITRAELDGMAPENAVAVLPLRQKA